MGTYEHVIAWQVSYSLTKAIYELTRTFPPDERFGLVSQMRRAAVSIPSNIAEGFHRKTRVEYRQFCYVAYGSAAELHTQIKIAKDLHMAPDEKFEQTEKLINRTRRLLCKLCQSLI